MQHIFYRLFAFPKLRVNKVDQRSTTVRGASDIREFKQASTATSFNETG